MYLEKREESRHICQQCDLVEELSNKDLENIAGGVAWSGAGFNKMVWPLYGIQPRPLYGIWPGRLLEIGMER